MGCVVSVSRHSAEAGGVLGVVPPREQQPRGTALPGLLHSPHPRSWCVLFYSDSGPVSGRAWI
eukprot:1371502-Rhodomonas_salina.2